MTILVTGGTGLLGNNVVRRLLEDGNSVRVLVRSHYDQRALDGLDVQLAQGDIRDLQAIRKACEGVSGIVHAAAYVHVGWKESDIQREINVGGTRNIVQAALEQSAKLVHVSSVDALAASDGKSPVNEGTPYEQKLDCGYVISKHEAEELVRKAIADGLRANIVNPGFMLGPWDWKPSSGQMLIQVATKFIPLAPKGGMSLCDVRDVSTAICKLTAEGFSGRQFILAGENITYKDAWDLFAEVSGGSPPVGELRPRISKVVGRSFDFVGNIFRREFAINSASVRMGAMFHYYDSGLAQKELGYTNRPMRQTVEDAWDWFKKYEYV